MKRKAKFLGNPNKSKYEPNLIKGLVYLVEDSWMDKYFDFAGWHILKKYFEVIE